jgi:hypothetical protein
VRPVSLLAFLCAASLTATGCASASGQARTIVLEEIRVRAATQAAFVDSYERALVSIAAITQRDLGLPRLQGVLHLVPDREALFDVLTASGADPATARGAADRMIAIGAFRAVYVNETAFARLNWNARLAVLAHEVAHAAQYEWAGGQRGTSDQWLREGFADWVQAHVLDALGVLQLDGILARNSRFIARPDRRKQLPPLSQLVDFPEWVAVSNSAATDVLYPYAYVAADFLVRRHGRDAVIAYFRLFADSDDRLANFHRAFGEEWGAFDSAFREHVAQLRPALGQF